MWMNLEFVIQNEVRKTNIVYQHIYMESRKTVLRNLFAGQEQRHRCINRLVDTETGRRRWDKLRAALIQAWPCVKYVASNCYA